MVGAFSYQVFPQLAAALLVNDPSLSCSSPNNFALMVPHCSGLAFTGPLTTDHRIATCPDPGVCVMGKVIALAPRAWRMGLESSQYPLGHGCSGPMVAF